MKSLNCGRTELFKVSKNNSRREFFKKLGLTAGAVTIGSWLDPVNAFAIDNAFGRADKQSLLENAKDEEFWYWIRQSYTLNYNLINLNNGGVSPQPKVVQDAFEHFNRLSNDAPSYYMWRILEKGREPLRNALADFAGCSADELVINRNTTEALDTIVFGLPLEKGDEIVLSKYDYPHMVNAWKYREKRDGIKLKWVDLPVPAEDVEEIVSLFEAQFTNRTKLVHITHLINWTGQILPAKKIAGAARKRGIEVLVDGAHSFAHIDYKIPDLDCDYFGTSLHKWMCAPFGNGMMYIKKDKITKVAPLFPNDEIGSDDIRKFEHLGTHSVPTEMAVKNALDFHLNITTERKEARLRYLTKYWVDQVKDLPKVKLYTSQKPEFSCALFTVGIEGKVPTDFESELYKGYQIHTTSVKHEAVNGIRITPHVYTSLKDLDVLVEGIKTLAK